MTSISGARRKKQTTTAPPLLRLREQRSTTSAPKPLAKLKRKLPAGLALGASVACSWDYYPNFGGGGKTFHGVVEELDDWIKVRSKAGILLHAPVSMLRIKVI